MQDSQPSKAVVGCLILVAATIIFALQDAITKQLTLMMPVGQIIFVRFDAFALLVTAYLAYQGSLLTSVRSQTPLMQEGRVLFLIVEMSLFAYALRFLGLAEMHVVFSCFPLVITALSAPMLGESVGWRRWLAVMVGFLGTLIILKPGTGVFDPYALIPLICAVLYSFYNIYTRKVARRDSFETSLLYFGYVGLIASSIAAAITWQSIPSAAVKPLAYLCITSMAAHLMLIKALELAPAVVLQPINYLILVWAVLIGIFYFGESISASTFGGVAIVVLSGLYVVYREYRLSSAQT
jgi:drug/metabolite transporter (DMT)-like permease